MLGRLFRSSADTTDSPAPPPADSPAAAAPEESPVIAAVLIEEQQQQDAQAPSSAPAEAAAPAPAAAPAEPQAPEVEVVVVEEAPAAPAEPEPPKMPSKPTAEQLEAAKEELVQEIVDKVLEIDGAVVQQITTAPYDPRFPSTNQSRHCFIRYNEFYKCSFERGTDDQRCQFYKNAYESLCPPDWVEEWEELRQNGLWFGKY